MNLGLCASLLAPSNTTDWVSCNVFAAEHDSHLRNGEQVCSFVALFMLWGRSCWCKDDTNQRPHSSSFTLDSWRESHAFLAFLGHFKFWMGFWHVLRCKGLKILNLKHMWKSLIEPQPPILATKRYVTFFWDTLYIYHIYKTIKKL